jgi:hypothetical protein
MWHKDRPNRKRQSLAETMPDSSVEPPQFIRLQGGLDLHTPLLQLKPGVLRDAKNFECSINGGYTRIDGYERVDGRPNPSDASFLTMVLNITGSLVVGDVMTGVTSGATGKVVYKDATLSLVAYTKSTGTFVAAETINVAATPRATVTSLGGSDGTVDFAVRMANAAADDYRADIGAIPGSGDTRGVIYHNSVLYGFRDNAGATAIAIYKATSSGWTLVPFFHIVSFTAGVTKYAEGSTITQGANSATVKRVLTETGNSTTWGGTETGKLIITAPAPGNFAAGAAAGGGACTLSGANAVIAPLVGGSYQFDIETVASTKRVYGCDGVNKCFEFDGTIYAPITTGFTPDIPSTIQVNGNRLWVGVDTNLGDSAVGNPYNWSVAGGAGSFLAAGAVTALKRMPGAQTTFAMAVMNDGGTQIMYGIGSTASPFNLAGYEDSSGAKSRSVQRLGRMYALDNQGITDIQTSQNYGNFESTSLTLNLRSLVQSKRNLCTGSVVIKDKSQYRLYFSDGSALYMTLANGRVIGTTPIQFPDPVKCICAGQIGTSGEVAYFGGANGMVYRTDSGTSFDGANIDWDMTLTFANQGQLRREKRYRTGTLEISGNSYASSSVLWYLDYSGTEVAQQLSPDTMEVLLSGINWDSGFSWDSGLFWDGRSLMPATKKIEGSGENIAMRVYGSSDLYKSFTINSLVLTYSLRRKKRTDA